MSTARARYLGSGSGEKGSDFSEQLKIKLRTFYPVSDAESNPVWGHPADAFVEAILGEAWVAKSALIAEKYEVTKAEIRAEQADLLKNLLATEHKLRNLSRGLDSFLNVNADPLGLADQIAVMAQHVSATSVRVERMEKAKKPIDKQHAVAIELAICVLRVLKTIYHMPVGATADAVFGYTSDAVKILKLIGDDLGLVRDELTWRDTMIKAKQGVPDLK